MSLERNCGGMSSAAILMVGLANCCSGLPEQGCYAPTPTVIVSGLPIAHYVSVSEANAPMYYTKRRHVGPTASILARVRYRLAHQLRRGSKRSLLGSGHVLRHRAYNQNVRKPGADLFIP